MKQIVIESPYRAVLNDTEIPIPLKNEVLLKTEIAGVCGSDIGLYKGTMQGYAAYPRVPGHEVSASVVETGSEVREFSIGDRVTVYPYLSCGKCYSCRRGLVNCCVNNKTMGLPVDGVFREYFAVPADYVFRTHEMSAEEAVMIEPVSIGYHAVRLADPKAKEKALVIGAGTIGIAAMLSLKLFGAEVFVANRSRWRLEKAKELGADGIIEYTEDIVKASDEITEGNGFDILIEATGDPQVLAKCTELASHRGRITEVGISAKKAAIPVSNIQKKELIILGSRNAMRSDFKDVADHISSGRMDVSKMITGIFSPDDPDNMFKAITENNRSIKNIIDFRGNNRK